MFDSLTPLSDLIPTAIVAFGAAMIPSSLILWVLKGQRDLEYRLGRLDSSINGHDHDIEDLEDEVSRFRTAKHAQANLLQVHATKLALLEQRER